jgi:lysophospholipase L1-like esterase
MTLSHLVSVSLIIAFSHQILEKSDLSIDQYNKSSQASNPEILFVGNSTMVPVYELFVDDQEPYTCSNIAVWGNTINQQLYAWNALTAQQKQSYDFVLVQIGLNDLDGDAFITDYQRLISQISADKKESCEIIAATESPAREKVDYTNWLALNGAIRYEGSTPISGIDHVLTANTTKLDVNGDGYLDSNYNSGDGIHPNSAGYRVIENNYLDLLKYLLDNPPVPPPDTTVTPVPPDTTVTPVPPDTTVTPVPPDTTVTPVPPDTTVTPVPPDTTVTPVPPDTTVTPVPPDTTVTPVPPDTTVTPVPPDTIVERSLAPSAVKAYVFSETNISLSWKDNSTNEDKFIITRQLASNPEDSTESTVNANDTSYTDNSVQPGVTYVYSVRSVNKAGSSDLSKVVVAAISFPQSGRIRDGLIACYNFAYNPEYDVYDISGDGDPLNLRIMHPSESGWNEKDEFILKSNNVLISTYPAKKIINEVKLSGEISVECWIRPAVPDAPGIGRIISIGNDENDAGFILNQEFVSNEDKKSLAYSTRLNAESSSISGYPELVQEEKSTSYINMYHLVYTRDSTGQERIYADGEKSAEGFRPGSLASWDDNYYLRLGNESDMRFPWNGSFYRVAIYKIALTGDEIFYNYAAGLRDKPFKEFMNYNVTVSPNPFHNKTTVSVSSEFSPEMIAPASLRILDSFGRVLLQEDLFDPSEQFTKTFDLSDFSNGLYLLQVISGNKQVSVKLIKN